MAADEDCLECPVCENKFDPADVIDFWRFGDENHILYEDGHRYAEDRERREVIKLASWNLKQMSWQKIQNKGVLTVICMTILENE